MADTIFRGFIPRITEEMTISQQILVQTAAMRKNGTFHNTSFCMAPEKLELLAMFAIDAKNRLAAYEGKKRRKRASTKQEGEK